ncbi:hypothetical protein GCM10027087_45650 [Paractinoplanes abujensis]
MHDGGQLVQGARAVSDLRALGELVQREAARAGVPLEVGHRALAIFVGSTDFHGRTLPPPRDPGVVHVVLGNHRSRNVRSGRLAESTWDKGRESAWDEGP